MNDLAGKQFGRLKVLHREDGALEWWVCDCACGARTIVRSCLLLSGKVQSCGCYQREWATRVEQARNRRCNIVLEHDGKKLLLAEWSEIVGIRRGTLWYRIKVEWTDEKVLTTPVYRNGKPRPV